MSPRPIADGPALAMLQLATVPCGLRALDALAKEAPVVVLAAGSVQHGHYLIAFGGEVEPVVRAFERAVAVTGASIVDRALLPDAEPRIRPAFHDAIKRWPAPGDALAVIETRSAPSILVALDAALKGAEVDLVELRLAEGLGGKALATLWGEVHDVEAAVELAQRALARQVERGAVASDPASIVVIPNADEATQQAVGAGTRFFKEFRG
jgi:microcompartment protein CcmL/EutN